MSARPPRRSPLAPSPIRVLLVEDSQTFATQVASILRASERPTFDVTHVSTLTDAKEQVRGGLFDVALVDLWLPDSTGIDTFIELHEAVDVPIVVLTGMDVDEVALLAVREGAQDYIVKPRLEREHLPRTLAYAVERHLLVREAWRARSDFFSSVSHEFRTPLFAIIGHAETMTDDGFEPLDDGWRHQFGRTIQQSAEYVLQLVDHLIELSGLQAGHVTPRRGSLTELAESVRRVCGRVARDVGNGDVQMSLTGDSTSLFVHGEGQHVERVVEVLLSAAVRRSAAGGEVGIDLRQESGFGVVSVRDYGEPIPDEVAARLFEPFSAVDARLEVPFALSMAIAKHLTELNGGSLAFETDRARGTTFTAAFMSVS